MRAGFEVYRHSQGVLVVAPFVDAEVSQIAVDAHGLRAVAARGETPLAQLLPCWTGTAQDDGHPAVAFWRPEHDELLRAWVSRPGWSQGDEPWTVYATPEALPVAQVTDDGPGTRAETARVLALVVAAP